MTKKIGFYGSGNMAQGMIQGLLAKGVYSKESILVYNRRDAPTLEATVQQFGITPITDAQQLFAQAQVIVLAVKPQVLRTLYPEIKQQLASDQLDRKSVV